MAERVDFTVYTVITFIGSFSQVIKIFSHIFHVIKKYIDEGFILLYSNIFDSATVIVLMGLYRKKDMLTIN